MFCLKMSSVIKISKYPGNMSYGIAVSHLRCSLFFLYTGYFMGNCVMKVMYYMAKVQKKASSLIKIFFFGVSGQIIFIT